ncbi:TlyA family RNA methyltransferase [Acetobacter thailandicus]|uniref:TlyA family RNA methyltransferase n=1 Tax=Acetobacter thailandicus TaxID=1502842 RepID=UPI001BA6D71A|nr:TlyA family RNA methyltransferase [Acetobacter thailandicus]MBS0981278.1 TlyA family RNA methyltransferase [Acetobacter thailandicus]
MARKRADQLLFERGLVESRSKAQTLIMAGLVFSDQKRIMKAGDQLAENVPLEVRGQVHPWVSRGGCKLAHALEHFQLSPQDQVCLDIGASTGGFTDVLLTNGARSVYAVDVGYGQLAWKLRSDPRVTVMEKCNARHLDAETISVPPSVVVCDASFIGLRSVLPAALNLAAENAWAVALIKPQFEAGREHIGAKGVVRDPAIHQAVCDMIENWWKNLGGWTVLGIEESPITGPEGNKEFLIAARKTG